jgi:nucleoside-diphosphate-sugar epimerase|tara:strand:- start:1620 stop:2468 length:849 start_codon:yes stop_codon:yes gene_type:complete
MKILNLGSSGQIGAYLTEYLREKGHEVTEYDKNLGPQYNLCAIPSTWLEHCIKESDFVFFLAFDVGGSRYLKKYQHTFGFIDNNTRMMANVFGLIEKYGKPFVFASSQMSNMSYSPYGVMKRVGELYTKSLGGKIVHFWNVYGIENDLEKAHVITDFIKKGFETGDISMLTDGTEQREFLYAEDCCEALEAVMNNYNEFSSDDNLHITSFKQTSILEIGEIIQSLFKDIGKDVTVSPAKSKDEVQKDKRNEADTFITQWWKPKTSIQDGVANVFNDMKKIYD